MGAFMHGWWPVVILVVVLLLFGAPKLPALAKSLGQSMRIFRSEVKQMRDESGTASTAAPVETVEPSSTTAAPAAQPTVTDPATPDSGVKPGS